MIGFVVVVIVKFIFVIVTLKGVLIVRLVYGYLCDISVVPIGEVNLYFILFLFLLSMDDFYFIFIHSISRNVPQTICYKAKKKPSIYDSKLRKLLFNINFYLNYTFCIWNWPNIFFSLCI